jgi:hypothetical protein
MVKALMKLGIEGMYLDIIKAIYENPITNIIRSGEKLKLFPLKSRTRKRCPLSPLLCNIGLEFLARAIRRRNKRKEVVQLSLFADGMILYLKGSKNSTKKTY